MIGNQNGIDGLRVSDVGGLVIKDNGCTISLERIPAMGYDKAADKQTGNKHFMFLTYRGCSYLPGYLRGRIAADEAPGLGSALICRKRTPSGQMIEDMRGAFARSEAILNAGSVDGAKHRREMFLQSLWQQAGAYGIDPSSIRMQAGDDDGRGGMVG